MSKKEIPPEDKITLSPLEQYAIYGKFPFFMVIHILLLVFNTLQVAIILSEFNEYFRAQEKSFLNTLISESPKEKRDYPKETYLYTIGDIQNHLNDSVNKMLDANETFFNSIIYVDENNSEIEAEYFIMEVVYKSDVNKINKTEYKMPMKKNYQISKNDLGPFNTNYTNDEIKKYIDSIYAFYIEYSLKMYFTRYYKRYKECFIWDLIQTYDFSQSAHFTVDLEINNLQCKAKTPFSKTDIIMITHMWIHFVVLFFALVSAIFCLYSFHVVHKLKRYKKTLIEKQKEKKIKNPKVLKEIETIEGASKKWELLLIFSNLFQIIGTLISLMKQENMNYSTNFVMAVGSLLCYISMGKYMDYDANNSLFFRSLSNLWSIFFPFFLATIPLFIAFTLVGACLFWNSERFTNLSNVVMDLFSLFLGDSIYDITDDLTDKDKLLGVIYCYVYNMLFICVVMNVFNSIVQSAFIKAKVQGQNNWIYNSLMKENHELSNENLRNLPSIDTMSPEEIIEEMHKRFIAMNDGLNKCVDLIQDVDNKKNDNETKSLLKKIIYRKVEEIDKKFEFIKLAWKHS